MTRRFQPFNRYFLERAFLDSFRVLDARLPMSVSFQPSECTYRLCCMLFLIEHIGDLKPTETLRRQPISTGT
jgi:hypothetical protein